jgi:D-threo-aldose 1-dehydrogenase
MTCGTESILLPGTAIRTSRVGFGCAQLMRIPAASDRSRLLGAVFDEGVRHFDAARMYGLGRAERELGTFLRGRRDQVTIATKFGIEPRAAVSRLAGLQGLGRHVIRRFPAARRILRHSGDLLYPPKDFSAKSAEASLDASLRALGTDYVDILFMHEPSPGDRLDEDLREFLAQAKAAGKIRAFGLAGELDQILPVNETLRLNAPVIQFRRSVFDCDACLSDDPERAPATMIFGTISQALEPVLKTIGSGDSRWTSFEERIASRLTDRKTVARLLFWHAVHRNQRGVTLFSAGSLQRLRELLSDGIDGASTQIFHQMLLDKRTAGTVATD